MMTVKELSQLYWLNREIEADQKRLSNIEVEINRLERRTDELRRKASAPSAPNLSGMPSGTPGFGESKIERYVGEIIDVENEIRRKKALLNECAMTIHAKQILCLSEQSKLERYIAKIPDSLLRQIFTYRFINGLTWEQVSESIGYRTTTDSVKKACYRFISSNNLTDY